MNQRQWRNLPSMNHEEWLEWRRGGIGASDAPIIMGVSPWTTPLQLWENKLLGKSGQLETSSMRRGKDMEKEARKHFEEQMGTVLFSPNVENLQTPWLRASLDGIDIEGKIMVEIKCPNKEDHFRALTKNIPAKYFPQCQHQLAVTGLEGMYYFSFDGKDGVIVEVARDQKYIDEMLEKERDFWNKVLDQEAPEFTDKDRISMEKNKEWSMLSEKWKETTNLLKSLEDSESNLREQLIALSKGRSAIGNSVTLSKSFCKGGIDYQLAIADYLDNLRMHHPEIKFPEVVLEPYRKKTFTKYTLKSI